MSIEQLKDYNLSTDLATQEELNQVMSSFIPLSGTGDKIITGKLETSSSIELIDFESKIDMSGIGGGISASYNAQGMGVTTIAAIDISNEEFEDIPIYSTKYHNGGISIIPENGISTQSELSDILTAEANYSLPAFPVNGLEEDFSDFVKYGLNQTIATREWLSSIINDTIASYFNSNAINGLRIAGEDNHTYRLKVDSANGLYLEQIS